MIFDCHAGEARAIHRTENFEMFLGNTEGTVSHVPTLEKEWLFGRVLSWCC
jgi:hypothetical protein